MRMLKTDENKLKMDAHLDWHFRQNRRLRDRGKRNASREWYSSMEDWIHETEMTLKETMPFQEELKEPIEPTVVQHFIVALEEEATCQICNEPLKKVWNETEEEWMFENAIRQDDQVIQLFVNTI
jgi:pre-mRNA cleavage complex 2 protein Pcf11